MSHLHTFLIGGLSLGVGVAAAQAADLPFRKAAPVEYVRVCDAFGEGFFFIPGSDTCLKIGGQLRAEETFRGKAPTDNPSAVAYNQAGQAYKRDLTSFRARAYLNVDARTQTAYGTLRSFLSIRFTRDSTGPGPSGGRGATGLPGVPAGIRASTGTFQGLDPSGNQVSVDKAFIQFAGLTAGRAQSFFDFDAQSYELLTNTVANSNQVTELLGYTATFGGGFSATVSVEDANERRIGDNGLYTFSATNPYATTVAAGNINSPVLNTATGVRTAGVLAYGGERIPDVVANIRYDGAWGSAQLSGAYHQLNSVPVEGLLLTPANPAATRYAPTATRSLTADGFAVLGGVKILLPMLAKGDSLTLQGSYESGAMDYVNPVNYQPVGFSNVYDSLTNGLGNSYSTPLNDAFTVIRPDGSVGIAKQNAYGFYGAIRHYFVPMVYGTLYGDYLRINNPVQAQRLGASTDNADIWQVGGNVVWTPIKDFQIGAEVLYSNLAYSGLGATAANTPGNTTRPNPDDYRARFSIRRAF